MKLDIVFEDEKIIAVNKPSGMLSIPDRANVQPSLKAILQKDHDDVFVVHRIDRPTSGLIIFAKDADTHKKLSALFLSHDMDKRYLGLVNGTIYPESGTVNAAIMESKEKTSIMIVHSKGKESITDYETIEKFPLYSLVEFRIHTGRTHQIRVHTKYLGHSLVCDELYGDGQPLKVSSIRKNYKLSKLEEDEKPILSRLALHSYKLNFELDGKKYALEAPLPKDMRASLQQMRKK